MSTSSIELLYSTYYLFNPKTKVRDTIVAKVLSPRTLGTKEIAEYLVKLGCTVDPVTGQYYLQFLSEHLPEIIMSHGDRCRIGDLATFYPVITGTFPSLDASFDSKKNAVVIHATTPKALRTSLEGVSFSNVTSVEFSPEIYSIEDMDSHAAGVLKLGKSCQIVGKDLFVTSGRADEGLTLEGGSLAAPIQLVLTQVMMQSLVFSTPESATAAAIPAGSYNLVLNTRAGREETVHVRTVTFKVTVAA